MNDDLEPELQQVGRALRDTLIAYAPVAPGTAGLLAGAHARTRRSRRRRRLVRARTAVGAIAVISAVALLSPVLLSDDQLLTPTPSDPAVQTGSRANAASRALVEDLPTCGRAPADSPTAPRRIAAALQGPVNAASGSVVDLQVMLQSLTGKAERFDTGLPVAIVIIRQGDVVGRFGGVNGGGYIQIKVPASGQAPLPDEYGPTQILLAGCVRDPVDYTMPDASRRPLPSGDYELVAVLDGGGSPDTMNLVTPPLPLRITAADPDAPANIRGAVHLAAGQPKTDNLQVELVRDGEVAARQYLRGMEYSFTVPSGNYVVRYPGKENCQTSVLADPGRDHFTLLDCTTK